jgi:hypothetical protein
MLGYQAEAGGDAVLDLELRHVRAGKGNTALQRQDAHDGVEQRGLAGAVGADDGDDLVVADLERDRADRFHLAIGDMRVGDGEQCAHATAPR